MSGTRKSSRLQQSNLTNPHKRLETTQSKSVDSVKGLATTHSEPISTIPNNPHIASKDDKSGMREEPERNDGNKKSSQERKDESGEQLITLPRNLIDHCMTVLAKALQYICTEDDVSEIEELSHNLKASIDSSFPHTVPVSKITNPIWNNTGIEYMGPLRIKTTPDPNEINIGSEDFHRYLDRVEAMVPVTSETGHRAHIEPFIMEVQWKRALENSEDDRQGSISQYPFVIHEYNVNKWGTVVSFSRPDSDKSYQFNAKADSILGISRQLPTELALQHQDFWRKQACPPVIFEAKTDETMGIKSVQQAVIQTLIANKSLDQSGCIRFVLASAHVWHFGLIQFTDGKPRYWYTETPIRYDPLKISHHVRSDQSIQETTKTRASRAVILAYLEDWITNTEISEQESVYFKAGDSGGKDL